jgi:hypothetical protein
MDIFDEKNAIYEQMKLLSTERRELTKAYFELKERLAQLDSTWKSKDKAKAMQLNPKDKKRFLQDIEYQKYMMNKGQSAHPYLPYSIISLKIAAILKEAGRPLSNKELFVTLTEAQQFAISYKNLTHNILPRINKDSAVNVERAYRGYWQYRLH